MDSNKVTMNLGSGGREMHEFIKSLIIEKFRNGVIERLDDSAVMENMKETRIAMTTDSYVVSPLFFEGGDIGRLCISGTVNDLASSGARPYAVSLSFILEEGTPFETIEKVIDSISDTCKEAGVRVVTGDTKVVEKGKGDLLYINTCGLGFVPDGVDISTHNARPGDSVIISGNIGDHEVAMMKARGMIGFDLDVKSDVQPLNRKVEHLLSLTREIHVIKDPTRGGLASALNEICEHSGYSIRLVEEKIPVSDTVNAVCELLGFDPMYLANEGKLLIVCPKEEEHHVLKAFGPHAMVIGEVLQDEAKVLSMHTRNGGIRRLGMLETTQLPRIC